jgi:hypothetical protein
MSLLSGGVTCDFVRLLLCAVHFDGKPRASRKHLLCFSSPQGTQPSGGFSRPGAITVPYIDINPHRSRPRWRVYVSLGVLALATGFVVFLALAAW